MSGMQGVERKFLGSERVVISWQESYDDKATVTVHAGDSIILGRGVFTVPVGYLPVDQATAEMLALSVAKGYLVDKDGGIAPGDIRELSKVDVRAVDGGDEDTGHAEWRFEYEVDLISSVQDVMSYVVDVGKDGRGTLRGVRW